MIWNVGNQSFIATIRMNLDGLMIQVEGLIKSIRVSFVFSITIAAKLSTRWL